MLSKNAIESALPLTEMLDASKIYLEPKAGTPLEALVQATRAPVNSTLPNYVPTLDDICYMANAAEPVTGVCNHDVVADEAAIAGIQGVQALMVHARTVVAPIVMELADKLTASLEDTVTSALKNMEVITVPSPELLYNESFVKEVMKYSEIPYDDPDLTMRLPTLPTSDIRDLMKIGGGTQEGMITNWLAAKGDDFLIAVWENIFQIKQLGTEGGPTPTFSKLLGDPDTGRDWALAVFLISRRLAEQGAPENTDMPASKFEQLIFSYRDQSAMAVAREINRLESIGKSGRLVLRATESKVWVDSKVYDAWLSGNGHIEVLYGNILQGSKLVTVEEIDAAATSLLEAWNKHAQLTKITDDGVRFTRAMNFLTAHFRIQLGQMTEEEKARTNAETVMRLYAEELRRITVKDLECLYSLCLRVVCRTRFYYIDAEALLANADTIAKRDPNVTPDEAMAMSSVQYIINWVAEQFLVKINPLAAK